MKGFIELNALEVSDKKTLFSIEYIDMVIDIKREIRVARSMDGKVKTLICNSEIHLKDGGNYACSETYEEIKQKIKEASI